MFADAITLLSVKPEIHVLGVSLKSFGIVFALGFLSAGAIVSRRMRELGKPVEWTYELVFAAFAGGLIGARVYYVVQNYSLVKHDLLGSLFSGSGLVWYGGVVGGAIAVIAWAAWRGMLSLALLDLASVPLALGYAIGRIGCQVSGDGDYGVHSTLPTSMGYPNGTVPTPRGVTVLPTPIYETVSVGLIAWWLWRMRDRLRPGALFALYLVLTGVERLLIEFIRRNHRVLLGLTVPQIESIVLLGAGAAWLVLMDRRGGLRLTPSSQPVTIR